MAETIIKELKEVLEKVKDLEFEDNTGENDKGEIMFNIEHAITLLECCF